MKNEGKKMSKLELIPDHKKIDKGGDQRILEGQTCSLMSEEILKNNYKEHGESFGIYELYILGDTKFRTLKAYKIIQDKDYGDLENKQPDALIVDRRNLDNIVVIAVIEFKSPIELEKKRNHAFEECMMYAKGLDAKIGIVTDRDEHFWLNPQFENDDGYEIITREDGYPLKNPFLHRNEFEISETIKIIKTVLDSITKTNSEIKPLATQNPSSLADNVWQDIWLASGENPDACLATFVEIFVFKFLSDLGVLKEHNGVKIDFDEVFNKDQSLRYYFDYVRPAIKDMFPANTTDNTGIINGIVLDSNVSDQNIVFKSILKKFKDFGVLNNVDPEFKSRLYEKFLAKSIGQKNWGQFFTPRNVVKAIVEMSDIEKLPDGSIVNDPASGVGGFILEPYLGKRLSDYYLDSNGKLTSKLKYIGNDRDPQTIILAKSNMLIHVSQLLRENPNLTKEFATLFNDTFKSLHTSSLGSLNDTTEETYDLLMTNPPYVTAGSSTQKKIIKKNTLLKNYYKVSATGVEGLFIIKIIKSIKKGKNAFVIIPDGILLRSTDVKLRQFIRDNCVINAIISLPKRTFYSSPKKTYILAITKKEKSGEQVDPVFTYVITKTGETRDAKRFKDENDLPNMVKQYKYFMTDKQEYSSTDSKCKIQPITKFNAEEHWAVDRWWSPEEKQILGIEEESVAPTLKEYVESVDVITKELQTIVMDLEGIK
ncbi:MAG: SAM-dependent methyltransferase [Nitrosopumilus sp.]|uniref:HsdM family class I SAM-dependent methyltransferase n=1 Tax=Nitrosopumilus sp. TaxID=2024843 RepID=UPI00242C4144|nr:N-6 DNA methylase [Nitrosopumilus sp.]MCV0366322.1 SAM-dependent methyltransferase [Nitrosopumilus sp.]